MEPQGRSTAQRQSLDMEVGQQGIGHYRGRATGHGRDMAIGHRLRNEAGLWGEGTAQGHRAGGGPP